MIETRCDILNEGQVHRHRVLQDAVPLSYAEALNRWQHDAAFRTYFLSILTDAPFTAYRWETPAVTTATMGRPFEFILFDSPGLTRTPDPHAFARHFEAAAPDDGVVVFENLGKDALLVVPTPQGPASAYGHLAAFTRQASAAQNHALWQAVGAAMQRRITDRPVWLSTAGGGVSWLHVRLDKRPKYYAYLPYRTLP